MIRTLAVVALLATLGATPAAHAAEGDPPCLADTERWCAFVPGTGSYIQGCLERYWDELSPECRKHVGETTRDGVRILDACESDVDRLCADAYLVGGERVACLVKNRDRLSSRCRETLDDVAPKDEAPPKDAMAPTAEAQPKVDAEPRADAEPKVDAAPKDDASPKTEGAPK